MRFETRDAAHYRAVCATLTAAEYERLLDEAASGDPLALAIMDAVGHA